jgi:hypothetical protein
MLGTLRHLYSFLRTLNSELFNMNSKGNPVLIEMAGQLPEASKLYQLYDQCELLHDFHSSQGRYFLDLLTLIRKLKKVLQG